MQMIRFKRFIKEDVNVDEFKTFVEKVCMENRVDNKTALLFNEPEFDYKGQVYRVRFFPDAEVMKLAEQDGTPNKKMITKYLAAKMNPDRYVFFSKSIKGLENLIRMPNLFGVTGVDETQKEAFKKYIGVVFTINATSSIDLTLYTSKKINGDQQDIIERLKSTSEVLSFESHAINDIEALFYHDNARWIMETDLDQSLWEAEPERAEDEEGGNENGNESSKNMDGAFN